MVPDGTIERFRRDLDALVPRGQRIGVAVSGGADSLALLLLGTAARPGEVEAATVDHGLRPESRTEAEAVARTCEELGVAQRILTIEWKVKPSSAMQEQARTMRYAALADWMRDREIGVLLTGHHLDDQAETLVMRLNRGSGVTGLAGMRPVATLPGSVEHKLVRPLLKWRRAELEAVCTAAGETPIADPSNSDLGYERVRVRQALNSAGWLDAPAIAASAENLAAADIALGWAADRVWASSVQMCGSEISYQAAQVPDEIERRIVRRILDSLATEGGSEPLRRQELARLMDSLRSGRTGTLRGVKCEGGSTWRFRAAPPRRNSKG